MTNEDSKLAVGDIVILKSGGCLMTVTSANEAGIAVAYFNGCDGLVHGCTLEKGSVDSAEHVHEQVAIEKSRLEHERKRGAGLVSDIVRQNKKIRELREDDSVSRVMDIIKDAMPGFDFSAMHVVDMANVLVRAYSEVK